MKGLHPSCQSSRIFLREHPRERDVRGTSKHVPRASWPRSLRGAPAALSLLFLARRRASSVAAPGSATAPALWLRRFFAFWCRFCCCAFFCCCQTAGGQQRTMDSGCIRYACSSRDVSHLLPRRPRPLGGPQRWLTALA